MSSEEAFRKLVRHHIVQGQYPSNASLLHGLSAERKNPRSGLTTAQAKWRRDELERAGYDWEASKLVRTLVKSA